MLPGAKNRDIPLEEKLELRVVAIPKGKGGGSLSDWRARENRQRRRHVAGCHVQQDARRAPCVGDLTTRFSFLCVQLYLAFTDLSPAQFSATILV